MEIESIIFFSIASTKCFESILENGADLKGVLNSVRRGFRNLFIYVF
tara:strand:+ start:208 stop:348 length:141 start_codon:yes stop_codon:yes gene_type:complete